jgi:hypothetical protein
MSNSVYKEGIIQDTILRYPPGAEWMIGKKAILLEEFTEDGERYGLFEIKGQVPNGRMPFRMPVKFVKFTEPVTAVPELTPVIPTPAPEPVVEKKVVAKPAAGPWAVFKNKLRTTGAQRKR